MFGLTKMGVFPKLGPQKLTVFNHRCWTHEIFRIGEYKEEKKFDKIWGTKIGPYSNEATIF